MAHIVTDRVLETTTTTGTGNITLGGAVAQFQDFDSQMANADTTAYFIKGISGSSTTEWEVGLGTWNTGNTLSRTTVVRSSNSNAAVNFSAGTKLIGMTFTPSVRQPGMSFTGALTPATNDLAALGSSSLSWADLFLAAGGIINWNNGTRTMFDDGVTSIQVGAASFATAASTTTYPNLYLPAGTLMTTPADGAIEADATNFYGTTDAGNRGIIPVRQFIRADATRTFTSNTSPQAIFTSPTNGRLTLETGTYRVGGMLSFSSMSGTSGNLQVLLLGGGSATAANALVSFWGIDGTASTAGAVQGSWVGSMNSPADAITAAVGTGLWLTIYGSFEISVAGTIQPQIDMTTASAAVLGIGSFLEFERIGTTSVVSVGQWD